MLVPTAVVGAFLLFALYKVMQARREKPYLQQLIGQVAEVVEPFGPDEKGHVRYDGELWRAVSTQKLEAEEKVYIHEREGVVLTVSKEPPAMPPEEERQLPENPIRRLVSGLRKLWKQGEKP